MEWMRGGGLRVAYHKILNREKGEEGDSLVTVGRRGEEEARMV